MLLEGFSCKNFVSAPHSLNFSCFKEALNPGKRKNIEADLYVRHLRVFFCFLKLFFNF